MPFTTPPILAFGILVAIAATVYMGYLLFQIAQYQSVQVSSLQCDDGDVVKDEFLQLLEAAQDSMTVHDDGDAVSDSIYNRPEVVEAVSDKLAAFPNFRIVCVFDCDNPDLLFRKRFEGRHDRVRIKVLGQYSESSIRSHCKYIDDGIQAYLSWHYTGSTDRVYKTVDCSAVAKISRPTVIQRVLGDYKGYVSSVVGMQEPVAAAA